LKDIFAVQDQIAALIARNLQLKLGPASATGSGTTNVEALRLYLEGRDQWNLRTSQGFDRAEDLFRQAVALDPGFARPHVGLADVWSVRADIAGTAKFQNRGGPDKTNMFAEVNEALRLDPALPEAHATLGMMLVQDWRIQEGVKTSRRAVELNPNYASGRQWLALGLACDGWMDESLAQMERAVELDPLSHRIHDNFALALLMAGRPAEALPQAEKALELMPDSTQAAVARVGSLAASGRARDTLPAARRLLEATTEHPVPSYDRILFRALVLGGAAAEAEGYLTRIGRANSVRRFNLLLALGREQEALQILDAAWLTRSDIGYMLFAPDFDPIRGDPRFLKVLETTGLTEAHARAQAWRNVHPTQPAPPANSR
jgi:serine/threonine-protein kinase